MEYLLEYKQNFSNGCIRISGCPFGIEIEEGKAVLEETINFLQNSRGRIKPLRFNPLLQRAAKDHLDDIGPKGLATHMSSDKKSTY